MIQPPKGLIFISNDSLPEGKIVSAMKTRGRIRNYEPENECLEAWVREWAKGNGGPPRTGLTIAETTEAIEFLITEMRKREAALDLRLVAKTYRSFRRWKQKKTDTHWHILVISEIEQAIIGATAKQSKKLETAQERIKRERATAREIMKKTDIRKEQIKLWFEAFPNRCERTFDRRKREVKNGIE